MSNQSEAVKRWRKNTKQKLIDAFGKNCCVCGYNKCNEAMEFHHTDPTEKEFTWGSVNGHIRGWNYITVEIKKCVMVCSNCHKEVHAGMSEIPDSAQRFNEDLINPELLYPTEIYDDCPVCGKSKFKHYSTCSPECSKKRKIKKVDWDQHDIIQLVQQYSTYTEIGDMLGITGAAVSRRYKQQLRKLLS
jgi:hypothetical protein